MKFAESAPGPDVVGAFPVIIPDHQLLRQIGKGSYGEVWLAQNIMGTFRAIKIIRRSTFENKSPFERELAGIKRFEPISRTHEGFVDVLQIGLNEADGYFYYIMEVADDLNRGQDFVPERYVPRTLGKALGQLGRFPVDQCVQTGMALCQALDHLHGHGLVHRDIKPSNIVFINGSPKLADIGLVTDSEHAQTFVGTEGFIPPEGPGSRQADIYSLGKALYEIASGRDRLDFPALPASLDDFSDREQFLELNEALIRACRQRPEDRYAAARDMYEDLALLASSKSLRRLRALERRWQSAKRTAVAAIGIAAVVALIGFPVVRERQHAEEIRERKIGSHSANGIRRLQDGDNIGALAEFAEIFQLEKNNPERFEVNQTRVAAILAHSPKLTQMLFLEERVGTVQFSPDGKALLAAPRRGKAIVTETDTGKAAFSKITTPYISSAALTPDAQFVVTGSEGNHFSIWNIRDGSEQKIQVPASVLCVGISHDGNLVAVGGGDGVIRLWDRREEKFSHEMPGHTRAVRAVAFSPNDQIIASGGADSTLRFWDASKGTQIGAPLRHAGWVMDVAFNPKGDRVVTACHDRWAHIWSVDSREEIPSLMKHEGEVNAARYSPDGSKILTASMDGSVLLWDARKTVPLPRNFVLKHSSAVFSAAFSGDGRRIATGCSDGTVRIWDFASSDLGSRLVEGTMSQSGTVSAFVEEGRIQIRSENRSDGIERSYPVPGSVLNLELSENGESVAACVTRSSDAPGVIYVWSGSDSDPQLEMNLTSTNSVTGLTISKNGQFVAFRDGNLQRVFDTKTGAEWPTPQELSAGYIAFDPGGRTIAIGSGTKLRLFDLAGAKAIGPELACEGDVHHLAFSKDGARLLVSQSDLFVTPKPALMLNIADGGGTNVTKLWHNDGVSAGEFRFDGVRALTAGEAREAIIWDVKSGATVLPPLIHGHQVMTVAFSQDGQWIGTTSGDKTVQIWDGETGFPITPPLYADSIQSKLVFSRDRRKFVTSQGTQKIRQWELSKLEISPQDAVSLSHLLNSDLHRSAQPGTRQIEAAWNDLRSRIPQLFTVTLKDIDRWRTRELGQARERKDSFARQFYGDDAQPDSDRVSIHGSGAFGK